MTQVERGLPQVDSCTHADVDALLDPVLRHLHHKVTRLQNIRRNAPYLVAKDQGPTLSLASSKLTSKVVPPSEVTLVHQLFNDQRSI